MRTLTRAVKLGITLLLCLSASPLWAIDFPIKPITLLVGYAPGGPADLQARAFAHAAEPYLGQPLVVINKPGATGVIMMAALAKASKDGYTLGLTPGSLTVTPYFVSVPYDIKKDFTYLTALSRFTEAVVVRADSPWKTLPELIAYAHQNPGKLNIAVSGNASSTMLLAKMLGEQAGMQWTIVPFAGDNEVTPALLAGTVQVAMGAGSHVAQVRAGKFRILANATQERAKEYPDVPTLRELGFNLVSFTLTGIVGPKGLPKPIVQKLQEAFAKARATPAFQQMLAKMLLLPQLETGKDFRNHIANSYDLIGKFLKK